MAIFRYYWIW